LRSIGVHDVDAGADDADLGSLLVRNGHDRANQLVLNRDSLVEERRDDLIEPRRHRDAQEKLLHLLLAVGGQHLFLRDDAVILFG
jgi:hypothetical protein